MLHVGAQQRRDQPRYATRGLRRALVLVLVLVFSASGFTYVSGNHHTSHPATHSHELAAISGDVGGGPCCTDHDRQSQRTKDCSVTSACSLCAPVGSSAVLTLRNAELVEIRPEAVHLGRVPPPQLRPPELIANA